MCNQELTNVNKEDEKTLREIFLRSIRKSGFPIISFHDTGEGIFHVTYVDKNEKINKYGEICAPEKEEEKGLENLETYELAKLALEGAHKYNKLEWKWAKELIKEAKERAKESGIGI
jgi:hypothetical protein